MPLKRLLLDDFRNLHKVELHPALELNFVEGENGSGKTSILEAISTIAVGRSFRTRKYRNIIHYEKNQFALFAEVLQQQSHFSLGVSRHRSGKSQFKLNGAAISSAGDLAEVLPFQVINSHSFQLLEGGPSERRRFLDWMVFHVKHSYRQLWSDYMRCLKQRNSLLRSDKIDGFGWTIWDSTLSDIAEKIDQLRTEVVAAYLPLLNEYLSRCDFVKEGQLSVDYERGWPKDTMLNDVLYDLREKERKQGFTGAGPHKADIRIRFNRKDVAELFSRGQQKAVITAMYMAQLKVFKNKNNKDCVLLIDDLPAELDHKNQERLCKWIAEQQRVQTFITGIELKPIIDNWPVPLSAEAYKMFHVKHGQVTERSNGATHDR